MADCTRVQILKLSNVNYAIWKFKLRMLLVRDDLWDVVNYEKPNEPDAQWLKRNGKAMATISLLVEDSQLVHIRTKETAKEMWDSLQAYHQKSTLTSKVFLYKRLYKMRLGEMGDVEVHITAMLDIIEQLTALGERMEDHVIVALLLCSLPDSFDTLVMALESRPEEDLTLELVKGKIIQEWNRRRESKRAGNSELCDSEQATAMKAQFGKKSVQVEKRKCFYCKRPGHIKADCRKLKADQNASKDFQPNKVNKVVHENKPVQNNTPNGTDVVDGHFAFKVTGRQDPYSWYVDSGATCHMTNCRKFFLDFDDSFRDSVFVADGRSLEAKGKGSGVLQCIGGDCSTRTVTVSDVIYVPQLDGNLLSVERLTDKGLRVEFDKHGCSIVSNNGVIVAMAVLNRLEQPQAALSVKHHENAPRIHVWHRRFGHRNPEAIKLLVNKELGTGVHISNCNELQTCESCIVGKMARLPFPISKTKSSQVLDLVHTDVCGPMQTITPSGKKYILTFIDDYSRYSVVYLIAKRSDVFDRLQEFVRMAETQFQRKPKMFRSDRGGEYIGKDVKQFLSKEGIQWQYTAPYMPQQNGIAERRNRYLVEVARSMLTDVGMKNRFGGEAVMTATYLQNKLPSRSVEKTPHELWFGTVPDLGHVRFSVVSPTFMFQMTSKA